MAPQKPLRYRKSVAMMIVNHARQVWLGRRRHAADEATSWQMPQGGIDDDENPQAAMLRELQEEVGLRPDDVEYIAESKAWHKYNIPDSFRRSKLKTFAGQEQKYFLLRFVGDEKNINLNRGPYQEFIDWQWADIDRVTNLTVSFRRPIYETVIAEFKPLIDRHWTS